MSGPISSLSLVYVDTAYDGGLFSSHYIVHAVDKYGNPANKGERIYAGVVNGLALSSKDNSTLLSYSNGIIDSSDPATFSVPSANSEFGNIEAGRDRLIILANDYRHDSKYLGGWSIQSVDSDTNLTLDKAYDAQSVDNLLFVIGSEDRADTCGGALALADLFGARIRSRQNWKLLGYQIDLMTGGVAVAKHEMYRKFTKYQYPSKIIALGRSKGERKEEKARLEKLSKMLHCSTRKIKSEFYPYLHKILEKV